MAFVQKGSKLWVLLIALVVMAAMVAVNPAKAASSFTDVNDRYTEAVDYLVKRRDYCRNY